MRARAFPTHHPDSILTTDVAFGQNSERMVEVMDRRRGFVGKSASLNSDSTGRPSPGSLADILGNTGNQTPNSNPGQHGMTNPNPTLSTNGYTSSPLQNHAMPPPPLAGGSVNDVFPPISNPPGVSYANPNPNIDPVAHGDTQVPPQTDSLGYESTAYNAANFNFSAGQNGWDGLGNLNPVDPNIINPSLPVPVPNVPSFNTGPPGLTGPTQPDLHGQGGGGYHNPGHLGGLSSSGNGHGNGNGFPVNESQAGEVGFDWLNWLSTANVTMSSEEGMGSM